MTSLVKRQRKVWPRVTEADIERATQMVADANAITLRLAAVKEKAGLHAPPLIVSIPMRTRNPNNGSQGVSRAAAMGRAREHAKQKQTVFLHVVSAMRKSGLGRMDLLPAVVTLTRVSAGYMDGDGLAASLKWARDGIAHCLGVDDGGSMIQWVYAQQKSGRNHHEVMVKIERAL